ncbi:helix-turn-helix transcriptional regulator [Actinomadura sp. NAK00032]|uniref:helix-turn-helix domain-containing transcriptional regulator n=1 Tax=Actinomadura sp. NAK00032 TaxID=2742128 RepID=UPI00159076FB|nr:helix-turn-helix transcriptional regulator [Actinomadura sp. NAK00032]QKW36244.1 helix-turn-helix transcriptional regulator [Actinomadura sp. NAK00032]
MTAYDKAKAEFALALGAAIGGRQWTEVAKTSGIPRESLYRYMSGSSIPNGDTLWRLLSVLDLSPDQRSEIRKLRTAAVAERSTTPHQQQERAGFYTRWNIDWSPEPPKDAVGSGRDWTAQQPQEKDTGPPPLLRDAAGQEGKPDPSQATTREEFLASLRDFWQWAGGYSPRRLSEWSRKSPQGKVSHTTLNALLAERPRQRPPVTMRYVQTIIICCGGDEVEVRAWTTAWRRLYLNFPPGSID